MSSMKFVFQVIFRIFLVVFKLLKITIMFIPRLLHIFLQSIKKRLRFSITFKTTFVYTLIFSTIFFILSTALIAAFGFLLLYESKNSLEKNSRVILQFINESEEIPEAKIRKYADIEGIGIDIMNIQRQAVYTTEVDDKDVFFRDGYRLSPTTSIAIHEKMYLTVRVELNDTINYLQISKPLMKEAAYLQVLLLALASSFVLSALLTIVIGARTSRRMLRPINHMTRTARSVSVGALHTRLDVGDSHDELKELAETFNEMLDRIQIAYEQQNRFVSDASHELRTPISVIQGYANLLQRWGKEEKAVLEESLEAIKNEADDMKNLVEKLLFLARADKNTQKLEKAPFSLHELLDEVLKETRLIDAEHSITSDSNEFVTVNADRGMIKQALRICVDNSMKYTPSGGTIKINSWIKENKVMLTIEDTGIGIAEEDVSHIFNRFYRCDVSRTRESGGAGLGLSIAKWIIEKHEGAIRVESALNKGTKIVIILPV